MPLIKLPPESQQIVSDKYAGRPIFKLQDAEINTQAADCLRRIHVITGWNLPDDIQYVKALLEEFVIKLKTDFYMMNFVEVIAAVRKYGNIVDWGKNMNLALLSIPLAKYCLEREQVSYEEEKQKMAGLLPPQTVLTDDQLDNLTRRDIELAFQCMRNGRIPIITEQSFTEVLTKDGLLEEGLTLTDFFVYHLGKGTLNIYQKQ